MTPTTSATPPVIYCRHCGYNLQGHVAAALRCPECGHPFDPANPRTFRRHPLLPWTRHIKRAAYALLTLTLILAAIWLWFFWGWYDEQRALKAIPACASYTTPLSPWLREHAGSPGFVLDRVSYAGVEGDFDPFDLAPLASLKKLEALQLRGEPITDLRLLAGCKNLRDLYLAHSGVTDLTPLTELTTLERLALPPSATDLRPLAKLTNLQVLLLRNANVNDLSPLAGLTELREVELKGTRVSDLAPLSGLTRLRELHLQSTHVSDLTPLSGLSKLEWLYLNNSPVPPEQVETFRRMHPACHVEPP